MHRLGWVVSGLGISLAFGALAPGVRASERRGPTVAVEDTLGSRMVAEPLSEILVTAPRLSLDNILRLVAEGEAHRDSLIQDQAYTLLLRLVGRDSKKAPDEKSEPYFESASRIYQERPDKERVLLLKEWSRDANADARDARDDRGDSDDSDQGDDDNGGVKVSVNSDMSEQFVAFAFDPATRSRYRFQIEDRKLIGDQLVYIIAFSPRLPLDLLPSGRVWVNTNEFVILREEFSYGDRSPAPLFLESLDSCVLERTRVDGLYWVVSRVLARVTLTDPIRWAGRIAGEKVPKVADFAMSRTDWIINGDIPDSLFGSSEAGKRK